MFCRMVALPVGRVPIVLKVDAPDSALTAAFQAPVAALAATYLPCPGPGDAPEYRAAIRRAVGFAIKGVLIVTGRKPDPYRGLAVPEGQGQVFLSSTTGPLLYLQDPTPGLRSATSRASRSWGRGRRHRSLGGARARPGRCGRAVPVRSDCVAARGPPASRGASRSDRAGYLRCAVADGTAPPLRHPTTQPGPGRPARRRLPGPGPAARRASPTPDGRLPAADLDGRACTPPPSPVVVVVVGGGGRTARETP